MFRDYCLFNYLVPMVIGYICLVKTFINLLINQIKKIMRCIYLKAGKSQNSFRLSTIRNGIGSASFKNIQILINGVITIPRRRA